VRQRQQKAGNGRAVVEEVERVDREDVGDKAEARGGNELHPHQRDAGEAQGHRQLAPEFAARGLPGCKSRITNGAATMTTKRPATHTLATVVRFMRCTLQFACRCQVQHQPAIFRRQPALTMTTGQFAWTRMFSTRGPRKRRVEPGTQIGAEDDQVDIFSRSATSRIVSSGLLPSSTSVSACTS
jgi:hypothetical protein